MGWVKRVADHVIQDRMGQADLEFAWSDLLRIEPKEQAEILAIYVKEGIKTRNEARDLLGDDPLPGGDALTVDTPQGPVPLAAPPAAAGVTKRAAATAPFAKEGFDPDQPRVPAGNPDGGEWTSDGGGGGEGGDGGGGDGAATGDEDGGSGDTSQTNPTGSASAGDSQGAHATNGEGSEQTDNSSLTGMRVVSGLASWYNLVGHRMANGKMFDGSAMNAAMLDVPFGTTVTVERDDDPSRSIQVTVTDRGPYAAGRVIDLTKTAFRGLVGNTDVGLVRVRVHIPQPSRR